MFTARVLNRERFAGEGFKAIVYIRGASKRLRSHWQTSVMCFARIMYLCISSVFPSECTWLLLRSVPTAPPDVWLVSLLDHMVASADAVFTYQVLCAAGKC